LASLVVVNAVGLREKGVVLSEVMIPAATNDRGCANYTWRSEASQVSRSCYELRVHAFVHIAISMDLRVTSVQTVVAPNNHTVTW